MSVPIARRETLVKPRALPATGVPWNELQTEIEALQTRDAKWRDGRVFGIYFPTRPDVEEVAAAAESGRIPVEWDV